MAITDGISSAISHRKLVLLHQLLRTIARVGSYRGDEQDLHPRTRPRSPPPARRLRRPIPRRLQPPLQAAYSGVYPQGLILDGERKRIEPLSRKATLPPGLAIADLDQALQPFVGQSTWDEQAVWKRYRSVMAGAFASPAGIFVIDDTGFPKQGKHSVGVQRQYCWALGKKANCQVAPSVHYVSPKGHYPLAMRLYQPESWVADAKRLEKVGFPETDRRVMT